MNGKRNSSTVCKILYEDLMKTAEDDPTVLAYVSGCRGLDHTRRTDVGINSHRYVRMQATDELLYSTVTSTNNEPCLTRSTDPWTNKYRDGVHASPIRNKGIDITIDNITIPHYSSVHQQLL